MGYLVMANDSGELRTGLWWVVRMGTTHGDDARRSMCGQGAGIGVMGDARSLVLTWGESQRGSPARAAGGNVWRCPGLCAGEYDGYESTRWATTL